MKLYFTKMQAQGNDYVYMDAIHQVIEDPGRLAEIIGPPLWNRSGRIGANLSVGSRRFQNADF